MVCSATGSAVAVGLASSRTVSVPPVPVYMTAALFLKYCASAIVDPVMVLDCVASAALVLLSSSVVAPLIRTPALGGAASVNVPPVAVSVSVSVSGSNAGSSSPANPER